MVDLASMSRNIVSILNFNITSTGKSHNPEQSSLYADGVVNYYATMAICELLLDADTDGFFHDLIRSAQTRKWILQRAENEQGLSPKALKASNTMGLFAALAANQWELARDIARLAPGVPFSSVEYEEDFYYAHFLHGLLLGKDKDELSGMLDKIEELLDGDPLPELDLCRSVLSGSADDARQAFDAFLIVRQQDNDRKKEKTTLGTDSKFLVLSMVSIEGLAWLRLLESEGIPTEREYPMCPSLARRTKYAPFVPSSFPEVPL